MLKKNLRRLDLIFKGLLGGEYIDCHKYVSKGMTLFYGRFLVEDFDSFALIFSVRKLGEFEHLFVENLPF